MPYASPYGQRAGYYSSGPGTGARVGQALSSAFGNIGDALFSAAQEKQRRKEKDAADAENQRRYEDSLRMREQDRLERQTERWEDKAESRRTRAQDLSMQGIDVNLVPPVSGGLMGDALTLGATQAQAGRPVAATRTSGMQLPGTERMDMASIVPDLLINAGGYNPEKDIGFLRKKAEEQMLVGAYLQKTDEMRKRGMTPGGAPIHPQTPAPRPIAGDPVFIRQTVAAAREAIAKASQAWEENPFKRGDPPDLDEIVRPFGLDSYEQLNATSRWLMGPEVMGLVGMERPGGGGSQVGQPLPDEVFERLRPGAGGGRGGFTEALPPPGLHNPDYDPAYQKYGEQAPGGAGGSGFVKPVYDPMTRAWSGGQAPGGTGGSGFVKPVYDPMYRRTGRPPGQAGAQPAKPLRDRISELKGQGLAKEEALQVLLREGYQEELDKERARGFVF